MSMSKQTIMGLVRLMMQGIKTDTQIDPVTAALHFSQGVQSLDLKYEHYQGLGYVIDGDDDVMQVHFVSDGVQFDDHHEHPQTLHVIKCALNALTHCEHLALLPDDDDSDDFDWV